MTATNRATKKKGPSRYWQRRKGKQKSFANNQPFTQKY